jgi:hypothetical protein
MYNRPEAKRGKGSGRWSKISQGGLPDSASIGLQPVFAELEIPRFSPSPVAVADRFELPLWRRCQTADGTQSVGTLVFFLRRCAIFFSRAPFVVFLKNNSF